VADIAIVGSDRPGGRVGQGSLPPRWGAVALAMLGLTLVVILAREAGGPRVAGGALVGAFAGLALYHAAFGFTAGWRRLIRERDGTGMRGQCLFVGLTATLTVPLLAWDEALGLRLGGFVFPFGIGAAVGAFLFGLGMQLGGGCGSGTLFTVGGGNTKMAVTLAAFILGSLLATHHLAFWHQLPHFSAISLIALWGPGYALAVTFTLLIFIAVATLMHERSRPEPLGNRIWTGLRLTRHSAWAGPWGIPIGAIALAIAGVATLLVLGRPWGITSAFALWGGQAADGLGLPIRDWSYWQVREGALDRTLFADATSVMNFGVMLGAMAAAGLAGRFRPGWRIGWTPLWTAVVGGLLMGYGARLAFGCNIGGFVGGVISGSLHGWWWLVFGFLGTIVGVWVRARVGLDPPLGKGLWPGSRRQEADLG